MIDPVGPDADEALHNTYDVFLFTLEALASAPEAQCERIGDFNTASELRDGALGARYLFGSGFLDDASEGAVQAFLAQVEAVAVDRMPGGAGRAPNLEAMRHPAWVPIRAGAQVLLDQLAPVTRRNRAFLGLDNAND